MPHRTGTSKQPPARVRDEKLESPFKMAAALLWKFNSPLEANPIQKAKNGHVRSRTEHELGEKRLRRTRVEAGKMLWGKASAQQ